MVFTFNIQTENHEQITIAIKVRRPSKSVQTDSAQTNRNDYSWKVSNISLIACVLTSGRTSKTVSIQFNIVCLFIYFMFELVYYVN